MIHKDLKINGLRWVHILRPQKEDIEFIKSIFSFHNLVSESVQKPTFHSLIEDFGDHLFLVLHLPVIHKGWKKNDIIETDFLITKETIITINYENFKNLDEIFENFSKDEDIQNKVSKQHSGILLYHIIDKLFSRTLSDLDIVEKELDRIEAGIFKKNEKRVEVVENISNIRMDILDFWRTFRPQQVVLKSLPEKIGKIHEKSVEPYFFDLLNTEERIRNIVENQKETIESLHQTNESLMASNTNQIISVLTVFSTIILPLNFIASIWGMNHVFLPLRDGVYDFWIIIFGMGAIAGIMLAVFRKIRWF